MDSIYVLCRTYGPMLHVPAGSGIDGARFMAAIAWCESSCGENVTPRYEASYDAGGENSAGSQAPLLAHYGKAAAYSYGPWQMMPCNAKGFTPTELLNDEEKCALAFVGFFNRWIIGARHALTFDEMAQCYNSGKFVADPAPGVERYVADALHYYQKVNLMATVAS